MIGYILTIEQKEAVHNKFINKYEFINCLQDINGTWYFLEKENNKERYGEYFWLFDLPQGEFTPPLELPIKYETN